MVKHSNVCLRHLMFLFTFLLRILNVLEQGSLYVQLSVGRNSSSCRTNALMK